MRLEKDILPLYDNTVQEFPFYPCLKGVTYQMIIPDNDKNIESEFGKITNVEIRYNHLSESYMVVFTTELIHAHPKYNRHFFMFALSFVNGKFMCAEIGYVMAYDFAVRLFIESSSMYTRIKENDIIISVSRLEYEDFIEFTKVANFIYTNNDLSDYITNSIKSVTQGTLN